MIFKKKSHPVAALIQCFFDNKQDYSIRYCITDAWLLDLISKRDYELLIRIHDTRFGDVSDLHHPRIAKLLASYSTTLSRYLMTRYKPSRLEESVLRELINIRLDKLHIINRIWEGKI